MISGMSFWKKLFSRQDRPRAEKLLERGFIHARKGRLKEALVAYEQSAAADESFAHAWLNQGLTLQDQYNARAGKMTAEEAAERLDAIADRFERALHAVPARQVTVLGAGIHEPGAAVDTVAGVIRVVTGVATRGVASGARILGLSGVGQRVVPCDTSTFAASQQGEWNQGEQCAFRDVLHRHGA